MSPVQLAIAYGAGEGKQELLPIKTYFECLFGDY